MSFNLFLQFLLGWCGIPQNIQNSLSLSLFNFHLLLIERVVSLKAGLDGYDLNSNLISFSISPYSPLFLQLLTKQELVCWDFQLLYIQMSVFVGGKSFTFLRPPFLSPTDSGLPLDCQQSAVTSSLCTQHLSRCVSPLPSAARGPAYPSW